MQLGIVGDREDLSSVYLAWRARERGASVLELWEEEFGIRWWVSGRVSDHADLHIEIDGRRIAASELAGILVRMNPTPAVPNEFDLDPQTSSIYLLERRYGLHFFLDNAATQVVNRLGAGRANSSKPYQMGLLETSGFVVPRWSITNVAQRAADFIRRAPSGAIYKACSGLRARVRRADGALVERLAAGCAAVLLQEYVPGTDVRVHVVGDRMFGSEVVSDAVDYRFDEERTTYRSIEVPERIRDLCLRHSRREELLLAGFDFRLHPDGTWWCLEANPVPTFLPYEAGTGQPIGDAILELFGTFPKPATTVSPLWTLASKNVDGVGLMSELQGQ